MAHVIARNIGGPRTDGQGGDDSYDNLILLCPTDHRTIDKAPLGTFSEELLHSWKKDHENWISSLTSAPVFDTRNVLLTEVFGILEQNRMIHEQFGPTSENAINNPSSSAAFVWNLRKLDTIVPNNKIIISAFKNNTKLLDVELIEAFAKFQAHAQAFESNQYFRVDHYPLFPEEFSELVKKEAEKN